MIYAVPQTDSTSEPAMAALVARLRAACPKPETIPLETTKPGTDASLALKLAEVIGDISSALGDRMAKGSVLLQWDGSLDGKCRVIAYRDWMNLRGRNRQAEADNSIDVAADEARAFLGRLRAGGPNGKSEVPYFVDSIGFVADAPGIKSSRNADDFIGLRSGRLFR